MAVAAAALAIALAHVRPGQTLRLAPGHYLGNFVLQADHVRLVGAPGTILDGQGRGSVLRVTGKGCTVEGLQLENSGASEFDDDAGLHLDGADGAKVVDVRVARCLNGVYSKDSRGIRIERLEGRGLPAGGIEDNGDGIHLFESSAAEVDDCVLAGFRDGCYLEFAGGAALVGDRVEKCKRYGLHVMFTNGARYLDCTFSRNAVGSVVMNSRHISVLCNRFVHQRGPLGEGLELKEADDSLVRGNDFADDTVALFVEGSQRNRFEKNRLTTSGWGLELFASSRDNRFTHNAFLVDTFEVAEDMPSPSNRLRGNFWSGDQGTGPYLPVRPFALWAMENPDLLAFADSPAARAIDSAFATLPALVDRAAVDPRPLAALPPDLRAVPRVGPRRGPAEDP